MGPEYTRHSSVHRCHVPAWDRSTVPMPGPSGATWPSGHLSPPWICWQPCSPTSHRHPMAQLPLRAGAVLSGSAVLSLKPCGNSSWEAAFSHSVISHAPSSWHNPGAQGLASWERRGKLCRSLVGLAPLGCPGCYQRAGRTWHSSRF